jgi:hypothetical protein
VLLKTLNEESVNSKNNDESKISDHAVYSDDVIEGIYNTGSGNAVYSDDVIEGIYNTGSGNEKIKEQQQQLLAFLPLSWINCLTLILCHHSHPQHPRWGR